MSIKNEVLTGGRGGGKMASYFSDIIESGRYPSQVNLFQKNEINTLWEQGSTMSAIQKLQSILEPVWSGKTLL